MTSSDLTITEDRLIVDDRGETRGRLFAQPPIHALTASTFDFNHTYRSVRLHAQDQLAFLVLDDQGQPVVQTFPEHSPVAAETLLRALRAADAYPMHGLDLITPVFAIALKPGTDKIISLQLLLGTIISSGRVLSAADTAALINCPPVAQIAAETIGPIAEIAKQIHHPCTYLLRADDDLTPGAITLFSDQLSHVLNYRRLLNSSEMVRAIMFGHRIEDLITDPDERLTRLWEDTWAQINRYSTQLETAYRKITERLEDPRDMETYLHTGITMFEPSVLADILKWRNGEKLRNVTCLRLINTDS